MILHSELSILPTNALKTTTRDISFEWPTPKVYMNKNHSTVLIGSTDGNFHWPSIAIEKITEVIGIVNFNMPNDDMVMRFKITQDQRVTREEYIGLTFIDYEFSNTSIAAESGSMLVDTLQDISKQIRTQPLQLCCTNNGLFWLMYNIYHRERLASI